MPTVRTAVLAAAAIGAAFLGSPTAQPRGADWTALANLPDLSDTSRKTFGPLRNGDAGGMTYSTELPTE